MRSASSIISIFRFRTRKLFVFYYKEREKVTTTTPRGRRITSLHHQVIQDSSWSSNEHVDSLAESVRLHLAIDSTNHQSVGELVSGTRNSVRIATSKIAERGRCQPAGTKLLQHPVDLQGEFSSWGDYQGSSAFQIIIIIIGNKEILSCQQQP